MMRKLILLLVLFPICSYAAEIRDTLYIRANSSTLDWDVSAGTHWEAVKDSNGAYIYTTVTAEVDVLLIDSLAAGKGFLVIDSVKHHSRMKALTAGARFNARIYLGANYTAGASTDPYELDSPWKDYAYKLARPSGGTWSVGDIDTLKWGVASYQFTGTPERQCDYGWIEVFGNDELPAGGPPIATHGPDGAAIIQGPGGKSPVHGK